MSCGPMLLTLALFCGEVCDVSCGSMLLTKPLLWRGV